MEGLNTLDSLPGMGPAIPASQDQNGSGDLFGDLFKPKSSRKRKPKKKKKLKHLKEFNEFILECKNYFLE